MITSIRPRFSAALTLPSSHGVGLLMVMAGTLLFSAKSIVIQWLFGLGVGVEQLLLMRMLISLPMYLLIGFLAVKAMRRQGKARPGFRQCVGMIVAGVMCYHAAAYLDMWALQSISAGLERTILFSYPLMIAVVQHCRGQKLTIKQWLSLCISYLGICLFYYEDQRLFGDEIWMGAIAVMIAAAFTAYFVLASQHYARRYHSDLFTAIAMGFTAFTITGHVGLFAPAFDWVISLPIILGVVGLALCCTVLAAFLLNRGIAASGAVYGSIAGMIGPLLTVILSGILLETPVTIQHSLALGLVILGVLGVQWLARPSTV